MGGIQLPKKIFNRFLFTRILKRTKHIFARDHETVDELKKHGYNNIEFSMDTSFFLSIILILFSVIIGTLFSLVLYRTFIILEKIEQIIEYMDHMKKIMEI